jgi:hypothetical protein
LVGLLATGPAGPAGATSTATPNYTYSSSVTAIGVQTALFENPEPSSIPDLTDVQTPSSNAVLNSFGTSDSSAHVGNLNGLGALPSLVCLASASTCNGLPIGTVTAGLIKSFPPPDPLDAHSAYPAKQSAVAPAVGAKTIQIKVGKGPFQLGGATAESSAHALSTSSSGVDVNVGLLGAISIGSVKTTTAQSVTPTGLSTTAESLVSNINIGSGKLLHIGSVRSTVSVASSPGKAATDTATSRVMGVKVLGQSATIGKHGIHVHAFHGLPKAVTDSYQKILNKLLARAGMGFKQAQITRSDSHVGHTVSVVGLELFFKHTVRGTPPVTVGLPAGVPCPIESITGKLPVDPCAGIGLSLNGKYRGQVALGQVGVISLAEPAAASPPLPGTGGGHTPGTTSTGGTGSTATGVSSGGSGGLPSGGSGVVSAPGGSKPPAVAVTPTTTAQSLRDPLAGLSHRLLWFFPLLALGVLAVAGRLRTPARFPAQK